MTVRSSVPARGSAATASRWVTAGALAVLALVFGAADPRAGAHADPLPDRVEDLIATLRPSPAPAGIAATGEGPRLAWTAHGTLRHLGAPPGSAFAVPGTAGRPPDDQARAFLAQQAGRFGIADGRLGFGTAAVRGRGGRTVVRLPQTANGVPVFGATAIVQLDAAGGVTAVIADLWTGRIPAVTPRLDAAAAVARALAHVTATAQRGDVEHRAPLLHLWAPPVLGLEGEPRLVWVVDVGVPAGGSARLLIDARDGAIVREYPLDFSALDRQIYDAANTNMATLVRDEGDPPSGIAEADAAYDQLASAHAYYQAQHGRDSYDDLGGVLRATVRYCPGPVCPWANAVWDGFYGSIRYGAGWATDDVTAHEFTHGVTEWTSGLIYENASGAMNESFSDAWGEFVDLSDPAGGFDDPGHRWLIGEALPGGAIRSMQDPPLFEDPDRLTSPWTVPPPAWPSKFNDYGGVHTNSGINNKLVFLLTDGGSFNGEIISGKGAAAIADLYYEAQTSLLVPAADWIDLFHALAEAAIALGWTNAERQNLINACNAVDIGIFLVDQASACPIQTGAACSGLTGPYVSVSGAHGSVNAGSTLDVQTGTYAGPLTLTKRLKVRARGGAVQLGP